MKFRYSKEVAAKFILGFYLILISAHQASAGVNLIFSVPPHAFLAEQIGGKLVKTFSLIEQGQDPHTFEPSPRQVMVLSQAGNFFTAGLEFEKRLLEKLLSRNHNMLVFDTALGIMPEVKNASIKTHGEEADQHIWLSPDLLIIQAENIYNGMIRLDPENQLEYNENFSVLKNNLREMKTAVGEILRPFAGRTFYVFHPAFGYLGRDFGLKQQAVEVGEGIPSPRQLSRIINMARADNIKTVFSQPQFDQRSAAVVAKAIGGKVVPMDPMERNILKNLPQMAALIKDSF